jgi:DNA-binding Lrp family transcriptional regulator
MGTNGEEYRLDEIDRRIIYALMSDARNTTAAMLAEETGVTGATIRNRLERLEERGIVTDYTATIDFERADDSLMNLFLCHAKFGDAEAIAQRVGTIPGVINVRELLGGQMNLHILAVGTDTADLRRIGRELEGAGVDIEDEFLLQDELQFPYAPYGPGENRRSEPLADYLSLAGGAEIVELTVAEEAPIAGLSLAEAVDRDILSTETLVVAIERDDAVITPQGETEIEAQDIVTVFSPSDSVSSEAFRGSDASLSSAPE